MTPTVTRIESVEFSYRLDDLGTDQHGFNLVYTPGESVERKLFTLKIETDEGITGAMKRARVAEGHVDIPEGPGLGVSYDWDENKSRATGSVHVYE